MSSAQLACSPGVATQDRRARLAVNCRSHSRFVRHCPSARAHLAPEKAFCASFTMKITLLGSGMARDVTIIRVIMQTIDSMQIVFVLRSAGGEVQCGDFDNDVVELRCPTEKGVGRVVPRRNWRCRHKCTMRYRYLYSNARRHLKARSFVYFCMTETHPDVVSAAASARLEQCPLVLTLLST